MPKYMTHPQTRITVGSSVWTNLMGINANVVRTENAFDVATILFNDFQAHMRDVIIKGAVVQIESKDQKDASWNTKFKGKIRFVPETIGPDGEVVLAKCDGSGYGFADTVCGQEYGSQSEHPTLDSLLEILTDASYGLVTKYVNKILGSGTASGFAYNTSLVDDITGEIKYLYFPFKPNSKCLCDLIDLLQAIKGTNAGPHWLVTPDDYLLVTPIGAHSAAAISKGWTTYVGGSTAVDATFKQKLDFVNFTFETLEEEANYILYYAQCLHPVNRDKWTEDNPADWDYYPAVDVSGAADDTAGRYILGGHSERLTQINNTGPMYCMYPKTANLGLNINALGGRYSIPNLVFWLMRDHHYDTGAGFTVYLYKTITDYSTYDVDDYFYATLEAPDYPFLFGADYPWKQYTVPVGQYWTRGKASQPMRYGWQSWGSPDWAEVNAIGFGFTTTGVDLPSYMWIDGVHFDGWVLRGAKDGTKIAANKLKMNVINDPFGKYDTLKASDPGPAAPTGTVAQLAYSELLRLSTTPMVGQFTSPMVKACLPGQLLHVHARPNRAGTFQIDKDLRVTRLTENFDAKNMTCTWNVTDDVKNARARAAFDSANELLKNVRPEFQDRQSTGTKLRDVDISAIVLEYDYNP